MRTRSAVAPWCRIPRKLLAVTMLLTAVAGSTAYANSLRGSKSSIHRMYAFAVRHDMPFLRTSADVDSAVTRGQLVPVSGNAYYEVSAAVAFPVLTPEARHFVEQLAPSYMRACGIPMVITSAVRPTTRQPRNASDLSVHPTGIAVDLRKPHPGPCLDWLRDTLLALEVRGEIEVTEERRPPHFHVAVLARPGSAPVGDFIARLAMQGDSPHFAFSTSGSFPLLEQRTRPVLAYEPLFRESILPSTFLATVLGESLFEDLARADETVTGVSAGEVELATADSTAQEADPEMEPPARPRTYTVRTGDTLWDIARKFGLSVGELQRANKLGRRSQIKPRQVLTIPQ